MAEVPRQKKVAFFDGGRGDMQGVYAGLFWYRARNDKQFRHLQYCLMDREKRRLFQENPTASNQFRITLATLSLDHFRHRQHVLEPLIFPPSMGDHLKLFLVAQN